MRRSSIRRTLLLVLAVALFPLMALAAWQGVLGFDRDRAATQLRLEDRAAIIVGSRLNPVAATASLLQVMATDDKVGLAMEPQCATLAATVRATIPHISAIAVHDPHGIVACAGAASSIAAMKPIVGGAAAPGAGSEAGVLVSSLPPDSGQPAGSLLLTLAQPDGRSLSALVVPDWLGRVVGTLDGRTNYVASLTDAGGRVLASSRPLDWVAVDMARQPRARQKALDGRTWLHGRALLFQGSTPDSALWLVLSQPEPRPFDAAWLFNVSFVLLPLVSLLLASLAIWIGAERTILRWVRDIGAAADEIGRGQRLPADDRFADAPTEIRALAAQMKRVSRIIAERDETLRRAAAQERLSALELNHRVRNNLQIIASWIALERGRLADDASDPALARVELRVAVISVVHRLFYDAGQASLECPGALLRPLCQLLERHGFARQVLLRQDHGPMPIGIDLAVPMALWVAEAALALPAPPPDGPRGLLLELLEHEGQVHLSLAPGDATGSWSADTAAPPMLRSIAQQLGGTATAAGMAEDVEGRAQIGFRLSIPVAQMQLANNFIAVMEHYS